MVSSHSNRFKIMSQDHTSLSLHPFPPALDVASLHLQTLPHSPSNRTGHPVSMALPTRSTESSGQRESVGEGTLRLRRRSSSVDTHCLERFQALSHSLKELNFSYARQTGLSLCQHRLGGRSTHSRLHVPLPEHSPPGLFPLVLRSHARA